MNVTIQGVDYCPEEDGITHINIYTRSKTELGRFLSNFTEHPVSTCHGDFASLEGLYHYLRILNAIQASQMCSEIMYTQGFLNWDAVKRLHETSGKEAQNVGRELRQLIRSLGVWFDPVQTPAFIEEFKLALKAKIDTSHFSTAFYDSTLPFTHYYIFNNKPLYKKHYAWLSDLVSDIRFEG